MSRPRRPSSAAARGRRGSSQVRLRVTLVLITIVLSVFGARLVQLQGLDPKAYAARAAASGIVSATLPASRGDIVDRNGVPLAESVSGMMIVADPSRTTKNAPAIARILADRLHLDYFDLVAKLTKPDTRFQYVARRIPSTTATRIVDDLTADGYKGLATRRDPLRTYPGDDVAGNLVGFMDAAGDPAAGLEQTFNQQLAGKDGRETYEVGGGNRIPLGDNSTVDAVNGKNLHLTIDRDVQWYAQRLLANKVHLSGADSGAAVVLDTQTGEVLALADVPTIDSNHGGTSPKADWGSRALGAPYEPGSVEKTLTTSALINEGLAKPTTRIVVPHQLMVPGGPKPIHDYFDHGRIKLTLAGAIALSSNIATVVATTKIAPEKLYSYLRAFGLGSPTGIGVPGESAGSLPVGSTWSQLTRANIAFGQGLSVNALQMAAAVNTIANRGVYISPSLIEGKATTSTGQTVGTDESRRHRVITDSTATAVTHMMELVTTEGKGTAPGAKVPGYRTAGKTGTAQEVGSKCKCYDHYDVSFAGFAPADKPRFTVYVVLKNPRGGASGGGTAGPVFEKLMAYVLQKYAVPPTETKPPALKVYW